MGGGKAREREKSPGASQDNMITTILDSLSHPFYVIDARDLTVELANRAAGFEEGWKGRTCHELTHGSKSPCMGKDHTCPVNEVRRTGKQVVVEHIHQDSQGRERIVEVHAHPVFDDEGKVARIIEYNLDITERRMAESVLGESEKKYRLLFEEASYGIVLIDKDSGLILDCNPEFEKQTGRTREDLMRMSIWEIRPPEVREEARRKFIKVKKDGKGESGQLGYQRPDGSIVQIEFRARTVKVGDRVFIQSISRDITARKESEDTLKASEQRYRRLFETAQDAILIIHARSGKIIDANPYIIKMLGYDIGDIVGRELWEIAPFKDIAENKAQYSKLMEEKYVRYEHLPLETKSGDVVHVEFVSNAYNVGGTEIIQCNIRDISKRKKTEEALQTAHDALEDKVRERTRELLGERDFIKDVLSNIPSGLIVFNRELMLVHANKAFRRMTGFSSKDLAGQDVVAKFWPRGDPGSMRSTLLGLNEGRMPRFETSFLKKGGKGFPVRVTPSALRDQGGDVTDYIMIVEDVTEKKRHEEEREMLRRKVEDYARRLEIRVRRLERKRLDLTENEKRVFHSLVVWPGLNDSQLSGKTGIKRSTLTAIRNRLLKESWLSPVCVPDLQALGHELAYVSFGRPRENEFTRKFRVMESRFRIPEVVLMLSTLKRYLSFSFFRTPAEAQSAELLANGFPSYGSRRMKVAVFPLSLCSGFRFMDFGDSLRDVLGVETVRGPSSRPSQTATSALRPREREVLHALVKHPGLGNNELSRLVGVTAPTLSRAKARLLESGLVSVRYVPNLKKLDQPVVMMNAVFNPRTDRKAVQGHKETLSTSVNDFIRMEYENRLLIVGIIKDFHGEREARLHEMLGDMENRDLLAAYPDVVVVPPGDLRSQKMDFSSITAKALGMGDG